MYVLNSQQVNNHMEANGATKKFKHVLQYLEREGSKKVKIGLNIILLKKEANESHTIEVQSIENM